MSLRNILKRNLRNFGGGSLYDYLQFHYWKRNIRTGNLSEKEIHALPLIIKPDDIVIDIGAHFGRFTYPLSKLVGKNGYVYSIEPIEKSNQILTKISDSLGLSNVSIHEVAISDKNGEIEIAIPVNHSGLEVLSRSRIITSSEKDNNENIFFQRISSQTLDHFVESNQIPKVDFIKCDVEGAELLVLKGSEKVLTEYHPALILEIEERHTKLFDYSPEEILSFLFHFGYGLFVFDGNNILPAEKITPDENNYIFLPDRNKMG